MTKRARYVGPHDEVVVQDSEAGIYSEGWIVKQGAWLPEDAPARVRDALLKADEWTEVKQAGPKKRKPREKTTPATEPTATAELADDNADGVVFNEVNLDLKKDD